MSTDKESSGGFTICLSKVRKEVGDVYPDEAELSFFSGVHVFNICNGGVCLSIPKKTNEPVLRIFIPGCDAPFKTVNLNHCKGCIIPEHIAKELIQACE